VVQVSIFPKAKAHPKSKKEKVENSKYASSPFIPEVISFNNEEELMEVITKYAWSPMVFETYRRESDFIKTDLIAFDIDEGMTIDEAEQVVESLGLAALCMPSTSHSEKHHKFRLIFPLSRAIHNIDEYKETYMKLAEHFPVDPQCKDACRFYFGSTDEDGFWIDGELYTPVKPKSKLSEKFDRTKYADNIEVGEDIKEVVEFLYGTGKEKIPEQIDYFIKEAHTGLPGHWHNSANSFIFTLALQNVEFEKIAAVFEQLAPEALDAHDEYLLERAYKDGQSKREDENKKEIKQKRNRTKSRLLRR
jgi:hypothetical protein